MKNQKFDELKPRKHRDLLNQTFKLSGKRPSLQVLHWTHLKSRFSEIFNIFISVNQKIFERPFPSAISNCESSRVFRVNQGLFSESYFLDSHSFVDVVTCLAIDGNEFGQLLVTGSKDTTIMVWEVIDLTGSGHFQCVNQKPKHILSGHDDEVRFWLFVCPFHRGCGGFVEHRFELT